MVDAAAFFEALNSPPGNCLEALKGDLAASTLSASTINGGSCSDGPRFERTLRRECVVCRYSPSMSSSLVPCPARRLFRACSMRRRKRGSCSRRYSNQSSSDSKPINTPAGLPWRVITISCVSAYRRNREGSSLISDRGTSFTPDFRIVRAMTRPPIWTRSPRFRRSCRKHHRTP
jgi:hypothetical protein